MTNWSALAHAYGSAADIPDLIGRATSASDDPVWEDLWSRLCHQGTVYSASYAALPELTRLAREWLPVDRYAPLTLAGAIVASTDKPTDAGEPHVLHATAVTELIQLTDAALSEASRSYPDGRYVDILEALLAFEGVAVWGEHLHGLNGEEYEVPCRACRRENFVVFGKYGYFSTLDDMYMKNDGRYFPLMPADPNVLDGLAKRLYYRATADDRPAVARTLTYVFGEAHCAACRTRFRVDEAVVARWS